MSKKFNGKVVGEVFVNEQGYECYYRDNGSLHMTLPNKEPSLTIQSEKDSCDLNYIMKKFGKTGQMTNIRTDEPRYGDFSSCVDYQTTLLRAQEAQEQFMELPAHVRARFSNDPGQLIDFIGNPENRSEAIQLGLIASPQASQVPQGDDKAASPEAAKT